MPVNNTHLEYDASLPDWARARDVLAGEDAVKAAGQKYLARLDTQTDADFAAYGKRAAFFNATARTAEGYVGLIFRRPPFVKLPGGGNTSPNPLPNAQRERRAVDSAPSRPGVARALAQFVKDADLLGTALAGYARNVVWEVIGVGRAGSLVDWDGPGRTGQGEQRAYVSLYAAEQIINWRVQRVNGRTVPTLVVLRETTSGDGAAGSAGEGNDEFETRPVEQIRVLKLVEVLADGRQSGAEGRSGPEYQYEVEIWRQKTGEGRGPRAESHKGKTEWALVERRVPLRRGKPLPLIPFVFHGPRHSRADVDRSPLRDIIAVNLDHYRLDADYKHGLHFTALPTAWVCGFPKDSSLLIGSRSAWVADNPGAQAGFLEFTGQGLTTFERAMDRDERLMAVLGSRLLEDQKKVGETAEAIELRQSGEQSVLSGVAMSVSESLTQVLRWVYWWNSTEPTPELIGDSQVLVQLNTDFSTKGMSSQDLQAVVAAWQAGAISQDTMFELFRKGEVLPEGRTNREEQALIAAEKPKSEGPSGRTPDFTSETRSSKSELRGSEQQTNQ